MSKQDTTYSKRKSKSFSARKQKHFSNNLEKPKKDSRITSAKRKGRQTRSKLTCQTRLTSKLMFTFNNVPSD